MEAVPDLEELIGLLGRDSLDLTITGTTRELRSSETWVETRVLMQGGLLRVEEPPGSVDIVLGQQYLWEGRTTSLGTLRVRPRTFLASLGLPALLNHLPAHPDYWREWLTLDPQVVEQSVLPMELHGRAAWKFTCPRIKDQVAVVTVDAETGLLLCKEGTERGVIANWIDLDMTTPLDESHFNLS